MTRRKQSGSSNGLSSPGSVEMMQIFSDLEDRSVLKPAIAIVPECRLPVKSRCVSVQSLHCLIVQLSATAADGIRASHFISAAYQCLPMSTSVYQLRCFSMFFLHLHGSKVFCMPSNANFVVVLDYLPAVFDCICLDIFMREAILKRMCIPHSMRHIGSHCVDDDEEDEAYVLDKYEQNTHIVHRPRNILWRVRWAQILRQNEVPCQTEMPDCRHKGKALVGTIWSIFAALGLQNPTPGGKVPRETLPLWSFMDFPVYIVVWFQ